MKFIVFSDLHAHSFDKYSKKTKDGRNTRLDVILQCLKNIRDLSIETGIRDILFAGDLFDAKNRVPMIVLNEVYREFSEWEKLGLNVLMIPGNHDFAIRTGEEHGLTVLSQLNRFMIVDKVSKFRWTLDTGESVRVIAIPYRERIDADWFVFDEEPEVPTILLGHGLVEGACYIPSGMALGQSEPVIDHEGISTRDLIMLDWLNKVDIAVIGHIHYPQKLGLNKHVLIPGMPWIQYPHERNQKRGIWIAQLDKRKGVSFEQHCYGNIPSFIKVQLKEDGGFSMIESPVNELDLLSGQMVLLQPESIDVNPQRIIDASNYLYNDCGVVFVDVVKCEQASSLLNAPRIDVSSMQDSKKVLEKVLKSGLLETGSEDIDELIKLGSSILNEVIENKNMGNKNVLRE